LEFIKEPDPAIRSNLFMANPAIKRISASIGARALFFGGGFRAKGSFWKEEKGKLGVSAPLLD
jgi:hypothetical protein